jgi:subtilisin-like proprotein convertase family protein
VNSLYASLDICREDVEALHIQSSSAIKAVAQAYGELAMEKTLANENYIKHVELQLDKLEHETMGAVRAVLEAGRSVREREKEVGGD